MIPPSSTPGGMLFEPEKTIKAYFPMKLFRNLLKGAALTTALFVFQACYGTPDAYEPGMEMSFHVVSKQTGEAVPDVIIKTKSGLSSRWYEVGKTDSQGFARIYGLDSNFDGIEFKFEGDGIAAKDTLISDFSKPLHEIRL